jgi:hypothetical protein
MRTEIIIPFLQGATTMGCLAVAACFLRFHRCSGERLFLMFSLGFFVFACERSATLALGDVADAEVAVFGIRALAFAAILAGIIDKNRSESA